MNSRFIRLPLRAIGVPRQAILRGGCLMVVRSKGGKLEVRKPEGFGHNSGEKLSIWSIFFRTKKKIEHLADRSGATCANAICRRHPPSKLAAL